MFFLPLCVVARAAPLPSTDDLAARVVILVNSRQPESIALGEFYAEKRGIPRTNLIALPMPAEETITWRTFVDSIWQPLQDELLRRRWIEGSQTGKLDGAGRRRYLPLGQKISYLVLCRGTPLRIEHDPTLVDEGVKPPTQDQFRVNHASVDSELTLIALGNSPTMGFIGNPLFNARPPYDLNSGLVVKVTRLDGPSDAAARRLVTSALEAERQGLLGRSYVDIGGPHASGDQWFREVRGQLAAAGWLGDTHDASGMFDAADRFDAPVLYFGWYANDVNGPFLRRDFRFPPGAIALHLHSYSAATLRSETAHWCGPLVARGVAATFGNVFEPYLDLTIHPHKLLPALLRGATLGDAAYFATAALSWQNIVLGDPLYRPFQVSLDAQMAQLDQLPPTLAGYAVERQVAALDRRERSAEADTLLKKTLRDTPSLSLALAAATRDFQRGRRAEALATLGFMPLLSAPLAPGDWALVRVGAQLVREKATARDALPFYRLLSRGGAPSADWQLKILNTAREVADAAGDLSLSLEFARQAAQLAAPPPAPPSPAKK